MSEFSHEVLADAERLLAPIRDLLAELPPAEAQRVRDEVCAQIQDGDSIMARAIAGRVRVTAEARKEALAASKAKAADDRIEAMRRELLAHPAFVELVHALGVEIVAEGTTPEFLRQLAADIPRLARRLRP